MALSASVTFEIRSTGNNNNGGGFITGGGGSVDYSQQDAPQVIIDNATITTSITGSTVTFTGGTYTPTAADVGNVVQFLSGTNALVQDATHSGLFQITGQTATTWTLDRSPLSAGTTTNATARMGGAFADLGKMGACLSGASTDASIVSGYLVFVKAGTYSTGSTANVAGGRFNFVTLTGTSVSSLVGYNTTRTQFNTDTTLPKLNATANSMILIDNNNGQNFQYVRNFIFQANGFTNCIGFRNNNSIMMIEGCQASGLLNPGYQNGFSSTETISCYANGCVIGFSGHETDDLYLGCVAENCVVSGASTGYGFRDAGTTGSRYLYCISRANGADGFSSTVTDSWFAHCTSAKNVGSGFSINDRARLVNCYADSNTTYGFSSNKASPVWARLFGCADFGNTSGRKDTNFFNDLLPLSLTADPSTAVTTGNFTPTSITLAAGYPATYPQNATVNFPFIGASTPKANSLCPVATTPNLSFPRLARTNWQDPEALAEELGQMFTQVGPIKGNVAHLVATLTAALQGIQGG